MTTRLDTAILESILDWDEISCALMLMTNSLEKLQDVRPSLRPQDLESPI
jgi:hypothetical protein